MPKGRWITDRMVEKSSTSADVKFNTCSPRSVSRNAVPLFDDLLVISPAAHRWPIRVRILPWLIPISSASPSTLPVQPFGLFMSVRLFLSSLFIVRCAIGLIWARGGIRTRIRLSLLFSGRPPLYQLRYTRRRALLNIVLDVFGVFFEERKPHCDSH